MFVFIGVLSTDANESEQKIHIFFHSCWCEASSPRMLLYCFLEADMVFCTYFSDLFHYPLQPTLQKTKSKYDKMCLRPRLTQRNLKSVLLLGVLYG